MRILHFLKSKQKKPFVSEIDFITNQQQQAFLTTQVLGRLREEHVEEEEELRVYYFFHTNTLQKAEQLATELQQLHYTAITDAVPNSNLFMITGQTTKMKMTYEVIKKWTAIIGELGYTFDCNFLGWETSPKMK